VCRHRSRQARGLDRRDGWHGRCAIYLQNARISPDAAFSLLARTAYVVVMAVIGGIGTMEGAIRRRCNLLFDAALSCQYFGAWYLIHLGTLEGLWGLVAERYGTRRRLVVDAGDGGRV
jgi:branched-chain amino acid transport system permease protein